MLEDGFIKDDNEYFNEAYQNVINEDNFDLSVDFDTKIDKYRVVFILKQHSD